MLRVQQAFRALAHPGLRPISDFPLETHEKRLLSSSGLTDLSSRQLTSLGFRWLGKGEHWPTVS